PGRRRCRRLRADRSRRRAGRRRVAAGRAGRGRGLRARRGPPLPGRPHGDARGCGMKVGVIGCGVISRHYTENAKAFDSFELVAGRAGLRIGCAPDICLGGAYQAGRSLIDAGVIGEPLSVSAAMLVGEQERWHPNPDIFFSDGAGPLLDMGPYYLTAIVALLGPVSRVAGFTSTRTRERTIQIGPRAGERFSSLTPSHASAVMQLESGVTANLVASFEAVGQYVCDLEIHGTEGVLSLPDPNAFGGPVRVKVGRGEWEDVPYASRGTQDARGLGLHDLAVAIGLDRPHRASGRLGAHVVEVARGILHAAEDGRTVEIESRLDQPEPLPVPAAA